jgi:Right handed beta helix region
MGDQRRRYGRNRHGRRLRLAAGLTLSVVVAAALATGAVIITQNAGAESPAGGAAPGPAAAAPQTGLRPPAGVCGNERVLRGPSSRPRGAVRVRAGNNAHFADAGLKPGRKYWFAPGVHTLGRSRFSQIQPENGDTFIGAPGAVISGQGRNQFAFVSDARNVTISYLTIEGFIPPEGQGAVNQNLARGWVISRNTIQRNAPGAGAMVAGDNTVSHNCLTRNGEYGFSVFGEPGSPGTSRLTGGPAHVRVIDNEISYNNTCNFEDVSPDPVPRSQIPAPCQGAGQNTGCGCSGGGKFWRVQNAVVDGNYVHNNYNVGLWADTNNNGFIFKHNYISDNYAEGILYEISYNALIEDNTFSRNAEGAGPANPGFPTGAIYISESGGDARVPNSAGIKTLTISGNTFTDNWSGVVLWESADRFCGSPNNSSTGVCTLVAPGVASIKTCTEKNLAGATAAGRPDLYDLCRWKTQHVLVRDNRFQMNTSAVARCRGSANSCGENAIFSQYGTSPSWSPYKGTVIERAVTAHAGNRFSANTYTGHWRYLYGSQDGVLSAPQWRAKGQD